MISILIPIYNGIEYIDQSVSSVINQTFQDWELFIGINGHPENSDIYKKALYSINNFINDSKYSHINLKNKIQLFDFYNIKGKSNTLNIMIKYCNYNYIALLDVDDIWQPNKLSIQVPFLQNYDVVGGRCIYFGERLNGIIPNIPLNDISDFNFFTVNPIINSSCIIKKEYAYWNSENDGVEDYDLWLHLRSKGIKMYNCHEILIKHRIHNDSAFNAQGNHNKVHKLLEYYKKL